MTSEAKPPRIADIFTDKRLSMPVTHTTGLLKKTAHRTAIDKLLTKEEMALLNQLTGKPRQPKDREDNTKNTLSLPSVKKQELPVRWLVKSPTVNRDLSLQTSSSFLLKKNLSPTYLLFNRIDLK